MHQSRSEHKEEEGGGQGSRGRGAHAAAAKLCLPSLALRTLRVLDSVLHGPGTGLVTRHPQYGTAGVPRVPGCCRGLSLSFLKPCPLALLAESSVPQAQCEFVCCGLVTGALVSLLVGMFAHVDTVLVEVSSHLPLPGSLVGPHPQLP